MRITRLLYSDSLAYHPLLSIDQSPNWSYKESAIPIWSVQDAKARFSEFLDTCLEEGPQVVTRRGVEAAVLVPVDEWQRLQAAARPSLKALMLSESARTDYLVPARGQHKRRTVTPLD